MTDEEVQTTQAFPNQEQGMALYDVVRFDIWRKYNDANTAYGRIVQNVNDWPKLKSNLIMLYLHYKPKLEQMKLKDKAQLLIRIFESPLYDLKTNRKISDYGVIYNPAYANFMSDQSAIQALYIFREIIELNGITKYEFGDKSWMEQVH